MAGDVRFKFTGDSSELRAELKKVEKNLDGVASGVQGMTNKTRKGLDGLSKSVQNTGATTQQAANNNQQFTGSLDELKDQAGETASIMGGLATSIAVVSPRAGAAVRALGDLATGVEAASRGGSRLFAILGPVGVAIAALGAAYLSIRSDLDAANEALEEQRDRLESVAGMAHKVKEAVLIAAHAELQAAKATGKATQAQVDAAAAALDAMAIAQKSDELFGARREALEAERRAIKDKIDAQKESTRQTKEAQLSTSLLVSAHAAGTQAAKDLQEATAGETAKLEALEQQLRVADNALTNLNFAEEKYTDALKRTKDAQDKRNKSTKDGTNEERQKEEALNATAGALAALQEKSEAAFVSQLNERHRILHSYQREIESINELASRHEDNQAIQDAANEASHNRSIQAMRELDALDAENAKRKEERATREREQHIQNVQSMLSASSSLFSSVATLHGISAENMSKTDRRAAMKAFRTQKGLSMAAATMSWGEAMIAAWKRGNVAEAILVGGAASAQYAASMAQINAQKPSFHSGTGLVRAPSGVNEMNATLRGGEAVSTPLGAELIGRSNIERANAGISPGRGGAVTFQYEHRVFSRFIRDNVRTSGPLGREQDRKIKVGHRRV
tara:strand:+ start:6581 stop:8449 length:1869 start_codon:yes stop_codon:yes gene_type:complete